MKAGMLRFDRGNARKDGFVYDMANSGLYLGLGIRF